MRFSVFLNARSLGPEDDRRLMRDSEAQALKAGALGFDAIIQPDHHFDGCYFTDFLTTTMAVRRASLKPT